MNTTRILYSIANATIHPRTQEDDPIRSRQRDSFPSRNEQFLPGRKASQSTMCPAAYNERKGPKAVSVENSAISLEAYGGCCRWVHTAPPHR